jgi:hypothetical protein
MSLPRHQSHSPTLIIYKWHIGSSFLRTNRQSGDCRCVILTHSLLSDKMSLPRHQSHSPTLIIYKWHIGSSFLRTNRQSTSFDESCRQESILSTALSAFRKICSLFTALPAPRPIVVQFPQQKIAYRKNSFFFLDRIYKTLSVVTVRKETNL